MVKITGKFESKCQLVAEIIDWFLSKFKIDPDSIELHVFLVDVMPNLVSADIVQLDEDYQYKMRIKVYRSIKNYRLIDRTFHELVHLRQYQSGDMKDLGHKKVLYKGTKYQLTGCETETELPWEIEAIGEEHNLSYDFCKSKGDKFFKRTIPKELIDLVFS